MKLKGKRNNHNLLLIFINVVLILLILGDKLNNSIKEIVEEKVNQEIYSYIFNTFDIKAITNPKINDLIYINKNDKGEIVSIDYHFNEGYVFLNDSMDRLYEDVNNIKLSDSFIEGKDNVFFVPSLLVTNNTLLNNFGMKIPVKIRMFKKVDMSFKTKVKEYGINNVLVELYLNIRIINDIITIGSKDSFENNFEVIIASKLITGDIPDYYGGIIEKSSSIVSS